MTKYLIRLMYPNEPHGIPITGVEKVISQQYIERVMSLPYEAIVVLDVIKFYGCTSLDKILTFFPCDDIEINEIIIEHIKMLFKIGLIEIIKLEEKNNKKWWHKLWSQNGRGQ